MSTKEKAEQPVKVPKEAKGVVLFEAKFKGLEVVLQPMTRETAHKEGTPGHRVKFKNFFLLLDDKESIDAMRAFIAKGENHHIAWEVTSESRKLLKDAEKALEEAKKAMAEAFAKVHAPTPRE